MNGYQVAKDYENGNLCGWLEARRPGLLKEQFNLLGAPRKFQLTGQTKPTAGRKMMLYDICRKVLGKDTENYAQEIGDCVSFGAKNGSEYLTCSQILGVAKQIMEQGGDYQAYIQAARYKFRSVFPPYYYGTGRVYVGNSDGDYSDGSLGIWMAEAVRKYGTLFSDEPNVPHYSGNVAKEFGAKRSTLDKWKPTAISYLVKSTAQIKSWDDLVAAICNGYPCPTASSIGYSMEPSSDGFHRQTTQWNHQMCVIGVDETYSEQYGIILNNWADCHGILKDFQTGEVLPKGVLRVRRADIEKHIRADETYAYGQFDAFKEQDLAKALFMLI